jgi:putative Holliday junction resolvase
LARILSIDYGLKRCGLAVTDPLQIIVNGLTTVDTKELKDFLINYCKQNEVEQIILGHPLNMDGSKSAFSEKVEQFKSELQKYLSAIPIHLFDERKTSEQAFEIILQSGIGKKKRSDKSLVDKVSAVIILQKYLGHI